MSFIQGQAEQAREADRREEARQRAASQEERRAILEHTAPRFKALEAELEELRAQVRELVARVDAIEG